MVLISSKKTAVYLVQSTQQEALRIVCQVLSSESTEKGEIISFFFPGDDRVWPGKGKRQESAASLCRMRSINSERIRSHPPIRSPSISLQLRITDYLLRITHQQCKYILEYMFTCVVRLAMVEPPLLTDQRGSDLCIHLHEHHTYVVELNIFAGSEDCGCFPSPINDTRYTFSFTLTVAFPLLITGVTRMNTT